MASAFSHLQLAAETPARSLHGSMRWQQSLTAPSRTGGSSQLARPNSSRRHICRAAVPAASADSWRRTSAGSAADASAAPAAPLHQRAGAAAAAAGLAAVMLAAPADAAAMLPAPAGSQQQQHSSHLQSVAAQHASTVFTEHPAALPLADLSLLRFSDLPRPDNPLSVLGYLLKHPVAALAVGGGLAILVPRLVRVGVRFVVVPALLLLAAYVAVRNPSFTWGAVSGAVGAVAAHPVATSVAILAASSLLLSPYILAAGAVLVLVTGTKILPPFLRPALPGPVSEALKQVDVLQGQTKTALEQLGAAMRPAPALKDGGK